MRCWVIVAAMSELTSPALRRQLSEAAQWDAEHGGGLSSHLPMALVALARLGADEARRDAFARAYAQRLHAAPPIEPWPAGDPWRERLGQPRAWPLYRDLWREWLKHEGASDTLQQVLPVLLQGVGAAAFHGAIRAAYALAANHADELADALAYWSCRWFACGRADGDDSSADSASVLAALDGIAAEIAPARLISEQMAHAAAHPRFAPAIARWRVDAHTTLPRLAQMAAERYAVEGGFTTLHLVTGTHALAVLLPWLEPEDRLEALRHHAAACAAAGPRCRRRSARPACTCRCAPGRRSSRAPSAATTST
jgi:hypothetical protein